MMFFTGAASRQAAEREAQLQSEINELRQEIDDLRSGQGGQDAEQPADNAQTGENAEQPAGNAQGNSGQHAPSGNGRISMEGGQGYRACPGGRRNGFEYFHRAR